MVRTGKQIEDRAQCRPRKGPAGFGTRQHHPALYPLPADEFRPGIGQRSGRRAVRADETIHRPCSRRLSGILAADGVWPGGAAEPRPAAGRTRTAIPVPLSRRQPRDECAAEELSLGRVLQARRRRDQLRAFLAPHVSPLSGQSRPYHQVTESHARRLVEARRISGQGPRAADHGSGRGPLLRRREPGAAPVLPQQAAQQPRVAVGDAAGRRPDARPECVSEEQHHRQGDEAPANRRPAASNPTRIGRTDRAPEMSPPMPKPPALLLLLVALAACTPVGTVQVDRDLSRSIDSGQLTGDRLAAAYVDRGTLRLLNDDIDAAIVDYDAAVAAAPDTIAAYVWRGRAFDAKNEDRRAFADFDRAIALDPQAWQAYGARGLLLARTNEPDRALSDLARAIELGRNHEKDFLVQ